MRKSLPFIGIGIFLLLISSGVFLWVRSAYNVSLPTSFEECVDQGGLVTEDSFPRTCSTAEGLVFTQRLLEGQQIPFADIPSVGQVTEYIVFEHPESWEFQKDSPTRFILIPEDTRISPMTLEFVPGDIQALRDINTQPDNISGHGYFYHQDAMGIKRNSLSEDSLTVSYEYFIPGRSTGEVLKLTVDVQNPEDSDEMRLMEGLFDQLMQTITYRTSS